MLRGLYSAAAGMIAQTVQTDSLADNLANITTTGFKRRGVSFQAFQNVMAEQLGKTGAKAIGKLALSVIPQGAHVQFDQGRLVETGNPLNVALNGKGFMQVQTASGQTAYSRDGRLTIDANGFLGTMDGNKIMGQGGPIVIPKDFRQIEIAPTGQVIVHTNNGAPNVAGKIKLAQFDDESKLNSMGGGLFSSTTPPKTVAAGLSIEQGQLEESNVNAVREMVDSMLGMRAYEVLQKSINMQNDTLGKAVNEVGKVM